MGGLVDPIPQIPQVVFRNLYFHLHGFQGIVKCIPEIMHFEKDKWTVHVDFSIGWKNLDGLVLIGNGGIEHIPAIKDISPVNISITVSRVGPDGRGIVCNGVGKVQFIKGNTRL